jgi:hypothetical protein
MERMGHDSMRAALIYQHKSREGDQRIAAGLSAQLQALIVRGSFVVGKDDHQIRDGGDTAPGLRDFFPGADDGNRTRTISLGS